MNVTALQTVQLQEEVDLLLPGIRAVYSPLTWPGMLKAPGDPGRLLSVTRSEITCH